MTREQFDKIDNTWNDFDIKCKKVCDENNVDYLNYLGSFVRWDLNKYNRTKKLLKIIDELDFEDIHKVKAVLNKLWFFSKETERSASEKNYISVRNKVFEWLDNTKDPYYFILNTVYNYGAGISYKSHIDKRNGYLKDENTGLINLELAEDYAKYRISKAISN